MDRNGSELKFPPFCHTLCAAFCTSFCNIWLDVCNAPEVLVLYNKQVCVE